MTDQPGPRRPLTRLLGAVRRHPIRTALLVGLGVVLAAGAAGYVVHRTLQAGDLWRQAQQAVADRDFERARECLQAYLAAQPDSGEAHLLMAQVCRRARAEDFDTAYEHLDAARRLGLPEKETEWEAHLHTYQASGNPQAGERHLLEDRDTGTGDERLGLGARARGCLRGDPGEEPGTWRRGRGGRAGPGRRVPPPVARGRLPARRQARPRRRRLPAGAGGAAAGRPGQEVPGRRAGAERARLRAGAAAPDGLSPGSPRRRR